MKWGLWDSNPRPRDYELLDRSPPIVDVETLPSLPTARVVLCQACMNRYWLVRGSHTAVPLWRARGGMCRVTGMADSGNRLLRDEQ